LKSETLTIQASLFQEVMVEEDIDPAFVERLSVILVASLHMEE